MEIELNDRIETLDYEIKYLESMPQKRSRLDTIKVLKLRRADYKAQLFKMKIGAILDEGNRLK